MKNTSHSPIFERINIVFDFEALAWIFRWIDTILPRTVGVA